MSDQPGPSSGAAPAPSARNADIPASIAIFQYDHVNFELKDPRIIRLPLAFAVQSTSELWKTSIMKKNDQDAETLPLTSFSLTKNSASGHTLMCPHGLEKLDVFVDNVQLSLVPVATSYPLKGGELVKLFTVQPEFDGSNSLDRRWRRLIQGRSGVGRPLVFQYRQATPSSDPDPARVHVQPGQRKLEELPMDILRRIFADLPVDEALYNIPATCRRFFEATRKGIAFHRWEISNGCLTTQEVAFCQGWSVNPASHLVLSKVPMVTNDDIWRLESFTNVGMRASQDSITSFEANLQFSAYDCIPGNERRFQHSACSTLADILTNLQALTKVKLLGFPTHLVTMIGRGAPLPNVEHLWFGCEGKSMPIAVLPEGSTRPLLPKLRRITMKFTLEGTPPSPVPQKKAMSGHPSDSKQPSEQKSTTSGGASPPLKSKEPPLASSATESLASDLQVQLDLITGLLEQVEHSVERRGAARRGSPAAQMPGDQPPVSPPWDFEKLFSEFSRLEETNIERILILESTGDSWKTCQTMLAQLKRLEGLSLTIDTHLTNDEMWDLIKSIPESVKFLNITSPNMSFTDDWCLAVATGCTNLEMFCCYGPEVTAGGVRPLVIACEQLTKLFLLHDENGVRVAREDILPDGLRKGVRVYERELSLVFD